MRSAVGEKGNHAILQAAEQCRGPKGFIVRMGSQEQYPQSLGFFLSSIPSG